MGAIKDIYDILSDMTAKAKTPTLKEEIERLRQSVQELAEDNSKLHEENAALTEQNAKLQPPQTIERSEIETRILVFLSCGNKARLDDLATHLGCGIEVARVHLAALREARLICHSAYTDGGSLWGISLGGTRYLMQRELVQ